MPSIYAIYAAPCMLPYHGSTTTTLEERRWAHKGQYNLWKEGKYGRCTAYDLFDAVGFDACIFEVVEELPEDCSKEQMLWRERWWMENHICVNKNRPICTKEETDEQKRQYLIEHRAEALERVKNYVAENRDKVKEYKRQHYLANRAKILEQQRQYAAEHKAEIAEQDRLYRAEHKAKIAEKDRLYHAANRAKRAEYDRQRRARKKAEAAESDKTDQPS